MAVPGLPVVLAALHKGYGVPPGMSPYEFFHIQGEFYKQTGRHPYGAAAYGTGGQSVDPEWDAFLRNYRTSQNPQYPTI